MWLLLYFLLQIWCEISLGANTNTEPHRERKAGKHNSIPAPLTGPPQMPLDIQASFSQCALPHSFSI